MSFDVITKKNYLLYLAKHYDNPNCSGLAEFKEDVGRLKYIKKLITKYEKKGILKERLILNHIIVLNNVFGPDTLCKIFVLKMNSYLKYLKPFLECLSILPDKIYDVETKGLSINTKDIESDAFIVQELTKI